MKPIRRILFVRTDRIGDVLMNLPAVRMLRRAHPKAWIAWLSASPASDLLKGHPDLDEVMAVPEPDWATFKGRVALLKKIRTARFDAVIVSNPTAFFHFLAWASGAAVRAGHDRKAAIFLNRRLRAGDALLGLHEIERNLKLAGLAGAGAWDGQIELPVNESAERRIRERMMPLLVRTRSWVVIHPGTSHPKKRWDPDRFGEVGVRVQRELDRGVLLIGGPEEKEAARAILKIVPEAVDWTGQTTIQELSALFAHPRISALVSSDSGPVHVAWIQRTPVVAFYAMDLAGSDPLRWGPKDGVSEMIHKNMQAITADEVLASLRRVLQRPVQKADE